MTHQDKVRETIRCQKCGRVLAKRDTDGSLHIKPAKGPQVLLSDVHRIMFVCEKISYFAQNIEGQKHSRGIQCSNKTLIENGEVVDHGESRVPTVNFSER